MALVAVRAQRLQLAILEFDRIAAVRLDVVGDARRDHSAFRQAQCAQRLALQLKARSAMPLRFVVQPSHR